MKENAIYRMYNLSSSTAPINKGTTNNEQQITQKNFLNFKFYSQDMNTNHKSYAKVPCQKGKQNAMKQIKISQIFPFLLGTTGKYLQQPQIVKSS